VKHICFTALFFGLTLAAATGQPIVVDAGGPTDPGATGQPSDVYTVPAALMPIGILPPGTNDPTMRYGAQFVYTVSVPNPGLYRVTLYFQEPSVQNPGERVFSVTANDQPILSGLDLAATAGYLVPTARQAFVAVGGTDLSLAFVAQVRSAVVSLIVVEPFATIQSGAGPPGN